MDPRIVEKTTIINDPISNSPTSKPFIVRIPHIQTKSPLNTESGKVVIVKTAPTTAATRSTTLTSTLQQQQQQQQQSTKSFSVVKLANGQIVLVPTTTQPSQQLVVNENSISRIIKTSSTSSPSSTGIISSIKRVTKEQNAPRISTIQIANVTPPSANLKSQQQTTTTSVSPQERRLRRIAPAPASLSSGTNDLLNSLLVQQQQLNATSAETLLGFDPTESVLLAGEDDSLPTISETVTLDSNGSSLKLNNKRKIDSLLPIERQTSLPVVSSPSVQQKPKNIRKTTLNDEKSTTKARLENKATSIIKDSRKKMTPRQVPIPQTSTLEMKSQKTPAKRPVSTIVQPKIDPDEGIR